MEFNHQRLKVVDGRRTVRIPKEYHISADAVFLYWNGSAAVVSPVNGPLVEDERKMARWVVEQGYDIPRPEEPS